jgi:CHAT domain-containing protein/tetratricopeptide (TPR) repeat protein
VNLALRAVCLACCLSAATTARGQDDFEQFSKWFDDTLKRISDNERRELERSAAEIRETEKALETVYRVAVAGERQNEEQFRAAAESLDKAIAAIEAKSASRRTFQDHLLLPYAYLRAGRAYSDMGEPELACARARKGWELTLAQRPHPADLLRAAIQVGWIHQTSDRPVEAGTFVAAALAAVERLPAARRIVDNNPLLAEAYLIESLLAHEVGAFDRALDRAELALKGLVDRDPPYGQMRALALVIRARSQQALHGNLAALEDVREAEELLKEPKDPKRIVPHGKLLTAEVLYALGQLHVARNDPEAALGHVNRARKMYAELFPDRDYPRSHPAQIQALATFAELLDRLQRFDLALDLAQSAWERCDRRFRAPDRRRIETRLVLARCLCDAGKNDAAGDVFAQAEAEAATMAAAGTDRFRKLLLAEAKLQYGIWLGPTGAAKIEEARSIFREAAAQDHPHLFAADVALGKAALRRNDRDSARAAFAEALEVDRRQVRRLERTAGEIEILSFGQVRQTALDGYLSATRGDAGKDADAFRQCWSSNRTVTRLTEARLAQLRRAADATASPELRTLQAQLVEVSLRLRQEGTMPRSDAMLDRLKRDRDRLELKLKPQWPTEKPEPSADELGERMPAGAAFVGFVRCADLAATEPTALRYVAFLVTKGRDPIRIELGDARAIDLEIAGWRKVMSAWPNEFVAAQAVSKRTADAHASKLASLVWKPIANKLEAPARVFYLSLDGELARFPFAVLPLPSGKILLEESTLVVVPHAPFVLERLAERPQARDTSPTFLALGSVEFGKASGLPSLIGGSEGFESVRQFGERRTLLPLRRDQATVRNLLDALPQADEAHLSTHAFFDDEGLAAERRRQAQALRDWDPMHADRPGSPGIGRRYPLTLTGLYLAAGSAGPSSDAGMAILTGEPIAQLPLGRLRCVVLSACVTGVGESVEGEGMKGLHQAFHFAGCPNAIASLWPVYDSATRALMLEYYRQRWRNGMPSSEALRRAQLSLYLDPGRVSVEKKLRGVSRTPDDSADASIPDPVPGAADDSHTPPVFWAAFVHSGLGDPFVTPDELPSATFVVEKVAERAGVSAVGPWLAALFGTLALGTAILLSLAAIRKLFRRKPS